MNGPAPSGNRAATGKSATSASKGTSSSRQDCAELLGQLARLATDGPAPAAQRLQVAADEAARLIAAGASRVTVVACLTLAAEAAGLRRRDAEAILRKALHAGRPS